MHAPPGSSPPATGSAPEAGSKARQSRALYSKRGAQSKSRPGPSPGVLDANEVSLHRDLEQWFGHFFLRFLQFVAADQGKRSDDPEEGDDCADGECCREPLDEGIRLRKLLPSDESLESVFSYLLEA